ncbi:MAG: hypothetical protein ABI534_06540 [Chloroflexota bacterium]
MKLVRRWAPLAIGVLIAGLVAFGYAQIAPGIANQNATRRATLPLPAPGQVSAAFLDDGRPVFVVNSDDSNGAVLDAQSSHVPSGMGRLLAWCPADGHFEDLFGGSTFAPDGARIDGPAPSGLLSYGIQALPDRTDLIAVTTASSRVDGTASGPRAGAGCAEPWVIHEPVPDEVFDPSVAIDQEPLGWVWLDGRLALQGDGSTLLCDAPAAACATSATVSGINPAYFSVGPHDLPGLYIGRVRDNAIEGLIAVPDQEETQ